ncbi:non-ribosomal peptide synthetase [Aquiflexum lacus]|uniref:non-ribosomal peptide synthetase n=1 Tax=Aquiflexum lacus TaxID=2483805 RepID=UPI001894E4F4|nr:non-ribosomal peptide synthetase [Aquiflexum lacus]
MDRDFDFESVDYDPFGEKEIIKVARLTDAQKEIWLSCIFGGDEANLSYNLSLSLRFSGGVNKKCLWEACDYLVDRHESLRMSFSADGNFFMVYNLLESFKIQKNFSILTEGEKKSAVEEFLDQEASFVFDFKNGPLVRFSLIELSHESFLFTITAHHLVVDGWSFGIMLEEIASIYNALENNKPIELPEAFQFGQYADEMELFSHSKEYQFTEKYWLEKYKLIPEQLELPTDKPRPNQRTFKSKRIDFELPSELVKSIKVLGKKFKSSLVSTIMAAFEIFLSKITGQDDLVLGLPAAGQAATDHLVLMGHCVNLLPIRAKVDQNLSFEEYLGKRRLELLDDYDHQKYTFGNLIKKLNLERDASRIPLVPLVFNIDVGMDDQVNFSGLEHSLISNPRKFENFEIFLNLTNHGENLMVEWSYNTNLFHKDTISYWMRGLEDMLSQVVHNPDKPIRNLILNESLVFQQLKEWNATFMKLPVQYSFLEIFYEQAKSIPSMISFIAGDKEFTFRDLRLYSNVIAKNLRNQGLGKGDVVGMMLDRNEMLLPALLGIMESGACYLPLDPKFPIDRLTYMLEDSGASLLVTVRKYSSWLGTDIAQLTLDDLSLQGEDQLHEIETPDPNDLAYILYTSGSTGKPKGVRISHLNLLNFLVSMKNSPGMMAGEKLLAITTISFDIAGLELYLPLIAGGTVVLANSEESRDGRILLRKMESQKIDIMQATPATWRMLITSGWVKPMDLKVLCGGEALNQDLAEKLLDLVGPFWNMYGPTETTIWSTVKKIGNAAQITIGRPIANTQIYILDENQMPCPVGRVGEICIGGLGVANGYHKRDDLTKDKFLPDHFSGEINTRFYRTGDLGRFQLNGEIVCLGRLDFQVKIRGYRIELGEIETKLNLIKGIQQAAVNTWEPEAGDTRLVAYLVRKKDLIGYSEEELIEKCKDELKQALPEYMVPTEWVFMDKLPFTNNNKVDRKSLPKPDRKNLKSQSQLTDPVTETQKIVSRIWQKVLGNRDIGLESDFFALGGHSLMAVELMVGIENETGQKLPVNSVFQYPTLKDFCKLLEPEMNSQVSWQVIVPIKPEGKKPPIFLIHGAGANVTSFYGLAKYLDKDQPVFGIRSKGLNGVDEPLNSIEEMASYYIQEIKKVHPFGTFHLGGQSFGAYVTFEMAKQLKGLGQLVGKIILFDVPAYQSETKLTEWGKVKMKVGQEIEKRVVDVSLAMQHPDAFKRMKANSFTRKGNFLKKWFGIEKDKEASDLFLTIEKIRKINHKAMDEYILSPYDGDIILFKAKIKTFLVKDKEFYGWKPYARQVIPVEVGGDHNSMIDDPELVEKFGDTLQKLIDKGV